MTWFKVADTFPDHRKHAGLSDAATALWFRGLAYSSRHLTDGQIPARVIHTLTRKPASADELVERGLWRVTKNGWQIVHYRDHQRSRVEIEGEREKARERQKRSRLSRRDNGVTHGGVTLPETEGETETDNPPKSPQGDHSNCPWCDTTGTFTDQDGRSYQCSGEGFTRPLRAVQ